jgi:hypothetical protein
MLLFFFQILKQLKACKNSQKILLTIIISPSKLARQHGQCDIIISYSKLAIKTAQSMFYPNPQGEEPRRLS